MKRIILCLLAGNLILACAGCGGGDKPAAVQTEAPVSAAPAPASTFSVTVKNGSSYIFNELYGSPTASNDWGADHLGSTSILKSNGSFEIMLEKYQFENYDILVLDADGDTYKFAYVPLTAGCTVEISFNDGLIAVVTQQDGKETVVSGELSSADSESDTSSSDLYSESFAFTVYNRTAYEIYSIYMTPADGSQESVDILGTTLASGESYDVEGSTAGTEYEGITNWVLYVVDVDGDVSASLDEFDPWLVDYVDVLWDGSASGYTCSFNY